MLRLGLFHLFGCLERQLLVAINLDFGPPTSPKHQYWCIQLLGVTSRDLPILQYEAEPISVSITTSCLQSVLQPFRLNISVLIPCMMSLLCCHIYIYKEELKTVVRKLLTCTQPNRHETSTALWNPYRRVSLRGRRAQIRFSRGACGEKTVNDRPPFWFYGESIRTSVHGSHNVIVEAPS